MVSYDASVDARARPRPGAGTLLISDTARSASDVIPRLVTAGYTTASAEVDQQLSRLRTAASMRWWSRPGVGGFGVGGHELARLGRHDRLRASSWSSLSQRPA